MQPAPMPNARTFSLAVVSGRGYRHTLRSLRDAERFSRGAAPPRSARLGGLLAGEWWGVPAGPSSASRHGWSLGGPV